MRGKQSATHARQVVPGVLVLAFLWIMTATALPRLPAPEQAASVTLSIVGTSDLHGTALPSNGFGGLPLLAGFVNNLRAARALDGGAVLLIDSGDTFQGDVASNLSEGALIVDAYNAMGYTAEAVGNHDFDFGSVDSPTARQLPGDLRGALKARAAQARYPFLAANLIDDATGRPVEWPNVRPSVVVEAAGVNVGVLGVMTIDALRSTLAANVQGLRVAPLGPTIAAEASKLRAAGAEVVIVASHAGGRCDRFDLPADLSSCESGSEIFQVARNLPSGLVDVIAAGHTHGGLAHQVNGIAIIQPLSRGQAFARVDIVFDRRSRSVAKSQLFAPRRLCVPQDPITGNCVPTTASPVPTKYEGRTVTPDPAIVQAMAPALDRVRQLQATPLGASLDVPLRRVGMHGSPIGNLFADALRDAVPGADVAVINNAARGLRADLPEGPITFGQLYDVFPFDNRVVRITVAGAELGRWLAAEIGQGRRGALGISGVDVRASCQADGLHVDLLHEAGRPIHDDDRLLAVTIGAPTLSGSLASPAPLGGVGPTGNAPVVREVVEDWFRRLGHPSQGRSNGAIHRGPEYVDAQTVDCLALNTSGGSPSQVSSSSVNEIIDNPRVRVSEIIRTAGSPDPMPIALHDSLIVYVDGSRMRGDTVFLPKGAKLDLGSASNGEPARAVVIGFKDHPASTLANNSGHNDAFDRPRIKRVMENDRVVVYDYTWNVGEPTAMHFHRRDVVAVFLEEGTLRSTTQDGKFTINETIPGKTTFNLARRIHTEELTRGKGRGILVELK